MAVIKEIYFGGIDAAVKPYLNDDAFYTHSVILCTQAHPSYPFIAKNSDTSASLNVSKTL